jgi:hypothetical protein
MDDSVRQMIGACYIAVCEASGPGVLEHANKTLEDAVESGAVSDPVACRALLMLTRSCRVEPVAADLSQAATALGDAIGDESLNRLAAHIWRRAARINANTPIDEIRALVDMADALEAHVGRFKAPADATVDA